MKKVTRTPIKVTEKKALLAKLAKLTTQRLWDSANLASLIEPAMDRLFAATYPEQEDRDAMTHLIKRGFEGRLESVALYDLTNYWQGSYGSEFRNKYEAWEKTMSKYSTRWSDTDISSLKVRIDNQTMLPQQLFSVSARCAPEMHAEVCAHLSEKAREAFSNIEQVATQFATMAAAINQCKTLEQIIELSPELETLARSCMNNPPLQLPAVPVEEVRFFIDTIKPLSKEVA